MERAEEGTGGSCLGRVQARGSGPGPLPGTTRWVFSRESSGFLSWRELPDGLQRKISTKERRRYYFQVEENGQKQNAPFRLGQG